MSRILVMVLTMLGGLVFAGGGNPMPVNPTTGYLTSNVLLVRSTAENSLKEMVLPKRETLVSESPKQDGDWFMDNSTLASCLWVNYPMAKAKYTFWTLKMGDDLEEFVKKYCNLVEFGFISYFDKEEINIYEVDENDHEIMRAVQLLEAGEKNTAWLYTTPGKIFRVKGPSFDKTYTAMFPSIHIVGEKPDYTKIGYKIKEEDKVQRIRSELMRVRQIKRVFTDVGFKKIKMPEDILADVQTYWRNNRNERAREEWVGVPFFVNWNEVNQDLVVPPFILKRKWQEQFMPVVEEWTKTKLEPTDIYGIRTYYDGAWLSNHVDREETHAASAILNVEQIGVREPWEVHIWDIHGKRQRVQLEPGYALLYESARCFHGRPLPFRGEQYTNVFIHYRPVGNPKWFLDPKIGFPGPDITGLFNPLHARTHDLGIVGEDAAKLWPVKPYPEPLGVREEL